MPSGAAEQRNQLIRLQKKGVGFIAKPTQKQKTINSAYKQQER
jgi:hypothetical protein